MLPVDRASPPVLVLAELANSDGGMASLLVRDTEGHASLGVYCRHAADYHDGRYVSTTQEQQTTEQKTNTRLHPPSIQAKRLSGIFVLVNRRPEAAAAMGEMVNTYLCIVSSPLLTWQLISTV